MPSVVTDKLAALVDADNAQASVIAVNNRGLTLLFLFRKEIAS